MAYYSYLVVNQIYMVRWLVDIGLPRGWVIISFESLMSFLGGTSASFYFLTGWLNMNMRCVCGGWWWGVYVVVGDNQARNWLRKMIFLCRIMMKKDDLKRWFTSAGDCPVCFLWLSQIRRSSSASWQVIFHLSFVLLERAKSKFIIEPHITINNHLFVAHFFR